MLRVHFDSTAPIDFFYEVNIRMLSRKGQRGINSFSGPIQETDTSKRYFFKNEDAPKKPEKVFETVRKSRKLKKRSITLEARFC
ncbi:MAG: hypothetical protein ABIB47_01975 [Candidatus Woesearchaeota archaeon]